MGNSASKIHGLVDAGDAETLGKLLEKLPDAVNHQNKDGETPIFRACSNGNAEIVALLLDYDADVTITCQSCMDMNALHMAATDDQPEIIEMLLEKGADPNSASTDGATPLHCAIQYACFEVAKVLITNGANIEAETEDGLTPIDMTPAELEEGESGEIIPLSPAQLQELRDLAGCQSITSDVKNSLTKKSSISLSKKDFGSEDIECMRLFFREAGLGNAESMAYAKITVDRGIKTGKKLAMVVSSGRMTLEEALASADLVNYDEDDIELIRISLREILSKWPIYTEDASFITESAEKSASALVENDS